MADKIVVEYQVNVDGLKTQMKTVQSEFKKTEKAGTDAGKKTEEQFTKTEKAAVSLRGQLRTLTQQLANATDPKEVERLAKAVGNLKDKLGDAAAQAKIFSSDSKFDQLKTAIGGVGQSILTLNFKDASEQARTLGSVIRSLSFKDVKEGIKEVGVAFLEIGKALIANPIFLVVAALTAIGIAGYSLAKSLSEVNTQTITVTESLAAGRKAMTEYADRFVEAQIKIKESLGIISKAQADALRADIGTLKERRIKQSEHSDAILKLAKELDIDLRSLDENGNATRSTKNGLSHLFEISQLERFNKEKAKLDIDFQRQQVQITKDAALEKAAIGISASQESIKKSQDAMKAALDKAKADNEKYLQEKEKAAIEYEKRIAKMDTEITLAKEKELADREKAEAEYDARIAKMDNEITLAKEKELIQQEKDEATKNAKIAKMDSEITKAKKDEGDKILADNKKRAEDNLKIEQKSFETTISLLNSVGEVQSRKYNDQLDESQLVHDAAITNLDDELKKKKISQDEYDAKKKIADKKLYEEQKEIKKRAFETNKEITLLQAIMSTAQATIAALGTIPYTAANIQLAALTAAAGAAQIAVIASSKPPKFEKGGRVKGERHYAGGTHIEAEKDEWIIRRDQAIKHDKLLSAINKGNGDDYIYSQFVAPALRMQMKKVAEQKEKSFASNLANSMMFNFKDENLLDSLKQSRKNDKDNTVYLAKVIQQNKINPRQW